MRLLVLLAGVAAIAVGAPVGAQQLRDFCPTRPGLGTPPCIMDKGHADIEVGLFGWTHGGQGSDRSDRISLGDTRLRYGLTDSLEVQAGWVAYTHISARSGALVDTTSGTGDLSLAIAQSLHNPDGSGFSLAVSPYVTLPVGSNGIGAGDWAAGLLLPMSYKLPHGFTLHLTPEADAAVNSSGSGRHFAYSAVVGLDVPLAHGVGATFEVSGARDYDPTGHSSQFLAAASANWTPNANLQFDIGTNIGLNRDAPGVKIYVGVAKRF